MTIEGRVSVAPRSSGAGSVGRVRVGLGVHVTLSVENAVTVGVGHHDVDIAVTVGVDGAEVLAAVEVAVDAHGVDPAVAVGVLGVVLSTVATTGATPGWYPLALQLLLVPATSLGGWMRARQLAAGR